MTQTLEEVQTYAPTYRQIPMIREETMQKLLAVMRDEQTFDTFDEAINGLVTCWEEIETARKEGDSPEMFLANCIQFPQNLECTSMLEHFEAAKMMYPEKYQECIARHEKTGRAIKWS